MSPEFNNQPAPPPFRFREANQNLNNQLQAQKALLIIQSQTIQNTQHTLLEFKKVAEEVAKDRVQSLKIIESLTVEKVAQEAEMTRLKVYHLFMTKRNVIHVLGAEGAGVSGHTSKNQACQCNSYSAISPSH